MATLLFETFSKGIGIESIQHRMAGSILELMAINAVPKTYSTKIIWREGQKQFVKPVKIANLKIKTTPPTDHQKSVAFNKNMGFGKN